jgi:hypothetical protein
MSTGSGGKDELGRPRYNGATSFMSQVVEFLNFYSKIVKCSLALSRDLEPLLGRTPYWKRSLQYVVAQMHAFVSAPCVAFYLLVYFWREVCEQSRPRTCSTLRLPSRVILFSFLVSLAAI